MPLSNSWLLRSHFWLPSANTRTESHPNSLSEWTNWSRSLVGCSCTQMTIWVLFFNELKSNLIKARRFVDPNGEPELWSSKKWFGLLMYDHLDYDTHIAPIVQLSQKERVWMELVQTKSIRQRIDLRSEPEICSFSHPQWSIREGDL